MNPTRRLALLALLILVGWLGGRPAACLAQIPSFPPTNFDPRYANWDTTLVRDTLGFTYERLFPLADSLRMTPDALKRVSTRWRWSLGRLVTVADSLGVPIDSVGPILDRERFNPLANITTRSSFEYLSRYSPAASGDGWQNTLDHTLVHGAISAVNHVDINLQQNGRGGTNGRTEGRTATSNISWKFSPHYSLGTNLSSVRSDNVSPSGLYGRADRTTSLGLVANTRPPTWHGLSSNVSGTFDLSNVDQIQFQKRGWRIGLSQAQLQYSTPWFSQNLLMRGSSSDFSASPTDPNPLDEILYPNARTRESDTHLGGTLVAFRGKPVELNLNYQADNNRVHSLTAINDTTATNTVTTPDTSYLAATVVPRTNSPLNRTSSRTFNAQAHIQPIAAGSIDLGWRTGTSSSENTILFSNNNSGENTALTAAARLDLPRGVTAQATFTSAESDARYPKRDFPRGGYGQHQVRHDLGGTLNVPVGSLFALALETDIQLTSSRYSRLGNPLTIPGANDNASQYYRITINPPAIKQRMTNTIGLKVTRSQVVNLAAASTAGNTDERTYAASWNWSYLLLSGLSANQINTLIADYTSYPFAPPSNNMSLNYTTITSIVANVGPRLTINTTHTSQFSPKGNYRPILPNDPTEYLSLSDETLNYALDMNFSYSVLPPFVTLNAHPSYSANTRSTSQNGAIAPQRQSRSLNFGWGASVNVPVGAKGRLEGTLNQSDNTSRQVEYKDTGINVFPRSSTRSLTGSLTFQINF